jgi:hypothetical protein
MSRSYTPLPPSASMACRGTALLFIGAGSIQSHRLQLNAERLGILQLGQDKFPYREKQPSVEAPKWTPIAGFGWVYYHPKIDGKTPYMTRICRLIHRPPGRRKIQCLTFSDTKDEI